MIEGSPAVLLPTPIRIPVQASTLSQCEAYRSVLEQYGGHGQITYCLLVPFELWPEGIDSFSRRAAVTIVPLQITPHDTPDMYR